MHIAIINGAPDDSWSVHEKALTKVVQRLEEKFTVDLFHSRQMNITYCCGCFSCWVKTPGLCVFKDDMEPILRSLAHADVVLYASPLSAGFITSDTKKVMDRFIPTALPYIKISNGECHHPNRYKKPKALGVLILDDGQLDEEVVGMVYEYFDRVGLNIHTDQVIKLKFNENQMGVLYDEIINC